MRDIVILDTERHYREEAEFERRCREVSPTCEICGYVIEEDFYELDDGKCYCRDCFDRQFLRDIDAYIDARL